MNLQELKQKWESLTDLQRWDAIFKLTDHEKQKVIIKVDNDATYFESLYEIGMTDDGYWGMSFEDYIGNGYGLFSLFESLGIKSEGV